MRTVGATLSLSLIDERESFLKWVKKKSKELGVTPKEMIRAIVRSLRFEAMNISRVN